MFNPWPVVTLSEEPRSRLQNTQKPWWLYLRYRNSDCEIQSKLGCILNERAGVAISKVQSLEVKIRGTPCASTEAWKLLVQSLEVKIVEHLTLALKHRKYCSVVILTSLGPFASVGSTSKAGRGRKSSFQDRTYERSVIHVSPAGLSCTVKAYLTK